jgi:hypothetical protein
MTCTAAQAASSETSLLSYIVVSGYTCTDARSASSETSLLSWSASFVGVLHTALYVLYSACSTRHHTSAYVLYSACAAAARQCLLKDAGNTRGA